MPNNLLAITVAFATPQTSRIIALEVSAGTTLLQAILQSGICAEFSELRFETSPTHRVGVYGELRELSDCVEKGDRIEIYRPLYQDPMLARKARVQSVKKKKFKPLRAKDLV